LLTPDYRLKTSDTELYIKYSAVELWVGVSSPVHTGPCFCPKWRPFCRADAADWSMPGVRHLAKPLGSSGAFRFSAFPAGNKHAVWAFLVQWERSNKICHT